MRRQENEETGETTYEPVTRIRIRIEKKWEKRERPAAEPGCITSDAGNWEISSTYKLRNALRGVVGYVDAVSPENDDSIVIEVKNRMHQVRAPELYDKLQVVTYLQMLGWSRGDLVQRVKDAPDAPVRVDRILRSDHSEDWARVVLPRLRAVAEAILSLRADEGRRRAWLAASSYERKTTAAALCDFLPLPPEPVDDDADFWASAEAATQQAEEEAARVAERIEAINRWLDERQARQTTGGLGQEMSVHKQTIIPLLDGLSGEAHAIGAVNTIAFTPEGRIGHNTDAEGFRRSIAPFLKSHHERALVLGTGGSAAAVCHVLRSIGMHVTRVSRNAPSAQDVIRYADLKEEGIRTTPLIVNCTPVGMHPQVNFLPPFESEALQGLGDGHLVVDLVYNPRETRLLREASMLGARTLGGLSMLEHQAEAAWNIWSVDSAEH